MNASRTAFFFMFPTALAAVTCAATGQMTLALALTGANAALGGISVMTSTRLKSSSGRLYEELLGCEPDDET